MKRLSLNAKFEQVKSRDEYLLGRHYTVYPVVMLRQGVHRGTSGVADYFDSLAIQESVNTWASRPITVGHPNESCGKPFVLEEHWIGSIFEPVYDDEKKSLAAEAWIDKERGSEILEKLSNNKQLDVSVGVWGDFFEENGKWNNEEYESTVKKLIGDHLAILPNKTGACSWDDGCGIRDYEEKMDKYIRGSARTPAYKGTETTSWAQVKKTIQDYIGGYIKASGASRDDIPRRVRDLPASIKRWIADKTLLGDPAADDERDLLFFPVVNPNTNKLNAGALRAVLSGRGSRADIPATALKSAQTKARRLLDEEFSRKEAAMSQKKLFKEEAENMMDEKEVVIECKEKEKKIDSISDALEHIDSDFKEQLLESYEMGKQIRENLISDIISVSSGFCKDWIASQSLTTLQALAELANKAKGETKGEKDGVKAEQQNSYALQAAAQSVSATKDNYIVPPKIEWR